MLLPRLSPLTLSKTRAEHDSTRSMANVDHATTGKTFMNAQMLMLEGAPKKEGSLHEKVSSIIKMLWEKSMTWKGKKRCEEVQPFSVPLK